MRRFILLAGFCLILAGCNGVPPDEPKAPKQGGESPVRPAPIYDLVIRHEFKEKKDAHFYFFVDGKDPAPELLQALRKQWPELQPGSKAPQGKADRVSVSNLKWIDANTAELRGGFSNGMDGHGSRFRFVRKDGTWAVESSKVEDES